MWNTNAIVAMLLAIWARAADLTFEWDDPNGTNAQVVAYYVKSNRPPDTNWTVVAKSLGTTNVPPARVAVVTNVTPGLINFHVTASNLWGESFPSEVLTLPATNREPTLIRVRVDYPFRP